MGKTSATVKNRYNGKVYDRIGVVVPKGRKDAIEEYARSRGESVNGLVNRLLQREMGLSDGEWKKKDTNETE